MKILIGCESSGIVRDAFIALGHSAISCDLKPSERSGPHIQADIIEIIKENAPWDAAIFFPECTYLCSSGLHWNCRKPGRAGKTLNAIKFVETLWECEIPKVVIENPRGCLPAMSRLMRESQAIQPYNFGEDASKETCLWIRGFPLLQNTEYFPPRIVQQGKYKGKERWSNQTDSGQNRLAPGETRATDRARTYPGIAKALAEQMGGLTA